MQPDNPNNPNPSTEPEPNSEPVAFPEPSTPPGSPVVVNPSGVSSADAQSTLEPASAENKPPTETLPLLQSASSVQAASKKRPFWKRKKVMTIMVVIAVLLLGGSVAAGYYGYYLPNKPENVVKRALFNTFGENGLQTQSFRYEGSLSFSGPDVPKNLGAFNFSGESDGQKGVAFKLVTDASVAKPTLEIVSPDSKDFYLRLSGLGGLDKLFQYWGLNAASDEGQLANQFAPVVAKLNNKWIELSSQMLSQMDGGESESTETVPELSAEDRRKVADAYKKHPFLKDVKRLGNENIAGQASQHFQIQLDNQNLKSFVQELRNLKVSNLDMSDEEYRSFTEFVDKEDISKHSFDLWVDKQKYINQLNFNYRSDGGTDASLRLTLKDRGAAVQIKKPEKSKSLMELMGELLPTTQNPGEQQLFPGFFPEQQ